MKKKIALLDERMISKLDNKDLLSLTDEEFMKYVYEQFSLEFDKLNKSKS
jgi:hypothetical protein